MLRILHQLSTPIPPDGVIKVSPAPSRPFFGNGPLLSRSSFEVVHRSSDAPADHSPEFFTVVSGLDPRFALSEHGPYLVGGTISSDNASFATIITIHKGADTFAPLWLCRARRHCLPTDVYQPRCVESQALGWYGVSCVREEMHPSVFCLFW